MKTQIREYINAQANKWAPTTLRSESARLYAASDVLDCPPLEAHERLGTRLKPYALKTTMLRLADYRAFLGDYSWKEFIKRNARLYKNAYTRRTEDVITFEEATRRAALLQDVQAKNIINELLHTGMRASEVRTRSGNNVLGKGSKQRKVFGQALLSDSERSEIGYREIYSACKAIGITPHQLRKAYINKIARSGRVTEVDMLKIMGWSSLETAKSYLQPMRDDVLADTLEGILSATTR
jgi:integrase